ncbi:MAG: NAD-dependent epimerase/dehydratase family protein [bacterium]
MKSAKDIVLEDLEFICEQAVEELGQMSGKSVLITGGGGFLGYYLVQSLLFWNKHHTSDRPIAVTVFDNFMLGVPGWLQELQSDANLVFIKHDITAPLPAPIDDFDYIIHAASIASPTFYRQYPIETMDANVAGLRSLLDYCMQQQRRWQPVAGFLFFSTSEIYGDPTPENIPTPENYRGNVSCTGPRACYDEAKRFGETLCVNFARKYALPIKIARPFNNYGPGLKIADKRVIPDFAQDIFAGRDLVMHSNGAPTRTFCYVTDAVVGYFKILVRGRSGEPYNIGVEKPEISIAQLASCMVQIAREHFGYQGTVVQCKSTDKDYLVDNPNRRCPMITKARKELNYHPKIALDEGLQRALIWYHDNRQGVMN